MSRIGKIARRSFLIGSATIAGGVAFGIYKIRTPYPNPLEDGLAEGTASFNPWVLIDRERVTLITPHADKGQGVVSSQAALIAEELDIEFGQFDVNFGEPDKAYWNTAMADEAVPFMSTDESFAAESMRSAMGGVLKLLGMQGTGGSTTIPDSFNKLRRAGAVARETLKLAASQQSGVPVTQLKTANGAVQLPDGSELKYTELAATAAGIEPVTDVELRAPDQWRLIGKPMQRLDIVAKSTGTMDYGIDLRIEGMVHAAVKMNPRQGGTLRSYDASEVEDMRGVRKIVPITNGVAVIANNTWRAIQAAEAITFDWDSAPYPAEQDAHWETISKSFSEENLDSKWRDDGDAEQAIAKGEVVSAEYRAPYVAHAPLEPLNATILVTDDAVEIWSGHQLPRMLQQIVASITEHEAEQVKFHNQFIGGSFGHRLEFEHLKQAAEIATQMRGTPVKLTYSREEDFAHDFPRHIGMAQGTGAVVDGKVEAIDLQVAMPSVISSQMGRAGLSIPGPDSQIAAGSWNNPYNLPNYRMRAYRVPELAPVSSWRSVGASANGFFFDSFLDELIQAAGADPMEERIRLMGHDTSRRVLEAVAEMSSWGGKLAANKGRGVSFVESFGTPVAEVVEVTNTDDGIRIDKVWVAADVGQIVDPVNFENLVQGGVVFGLGHAMNCEITYTDGMAEQANFWDAEGMRMYQCPEIFVRGLENGDKVRGIGEPPVPPAAPALAAAIFDATGQRLREMPFNKFVDFV
ncbi:xanthine dehydrogenase family protein molybdopterin-binding subunit [Pseudohalocynthiibacter aestuariivivens]|jgi:isoquinoline 1-oxidoreductase subunit beta|uniref:Xanthine dehydrogenase family protein molybdopterin-binding subunit n=1 Tax=Pseudohalocynthiibacter aestuariivivens TaxID=1591409 RepID=A0ABV5JG38_9RHOB|nr:molybdopterin cofactor-binding domain-containing protein [Pseudohalocynthiibacter sp. F2068]MBS9717047.1 xanthine dehydrogenase family protein molybdopterin-binding subunit [Pseudohalocynthiibacter aestuariivivens]MCK0104028.1 molybdopterin-dependent oxidoreductase [Pseudohalocynthiibacter sp. F2068]